LIFDSFVNPYNDTEIGIYVLSLDGRSIILFAISDLNTSFNIEKINNHANNDLI